MTIMCKYCTSVAFAERGGILMPIVVLPLLRAHEAMIAKWHTINARIYIL
jgi:hypothetical protein